ncbi:MAG: patatin-like phospholipase family protein [Parvularculaceae bacterium]|nr:patatin-like phospholipase family protein [Parvularculaceae bacterium]
MAKETKQPANSDTPTEISSAGQFVLVFQGGGALGAYQAGVYQAIHEAGIEPDWVIGTSIGAINASLIAGNSRIDRIAALKEFWNSVTHQRPWHYFPTHTPVANTMSYMSILAGGLPKFFAPNPFAFMGPHVRLGAESAGYYSTAPLQKTLNKLIDFDLLNRGGPRLTVGAAHVRSSMMRYFDSKNEELDVRHVMASGALPPAFPPIRIDNELYWDGGILSNTPTEIVFDDYPRKSSLIFAVHMWNPVGAEPETMWQVMHRQKDVQYSSRVASHIMRQKQTHRLRHIVKELSKLVPEERRDSDAYREMANWGCLTRMHVVRLLAPSLDHEDQTKDVDFSANGIRKRWRAGYEQAQEALKRAPWRGEFDPLDGVILHEPPFIGSVDMAAGAQIATVASPAPILNAAE